VTVNPGVHVRKAAPVSEEVGARNTSDLEGSRVGRGGQGGGVSFRPRVGLEQAWSVVGGQEAVGAACVGLGKQEDSWLTRAYRRAAIPVVARLYGYPFPRAESICLFGVTIGMLGAICGVQSGVGLGMSVGGVLLILSAWLDVLDGMLARARAQVSAAGDVLDSVSDRLVATMALVSVGCAAGIPLLGGAAAAAANASSYLKVKWKVVTSTEYPVGWWRRGLNHSSRLTSIGLTYVVIGLSGSIGMLRTAFIVIAVGNILDFGWRLVVALRALRRAEGLGVGSVHRAGTRSE